MNQALCQALNQVVKLDPAASKALRRLEDKSVGVRLKGPGLRLVLSVQDHRFVAGDPEAQVGAWIEASPGVLLGIAARGGQASSGQLSITGEADTAQRFQGFFRSLKPDWEEGLTRVFGDILGVQIARMMTGTLDFARRTGDSLSQDFSDYLREESRSLISHRELDQFLDQVDDLRDDLARFEARLAQLGDAPTA
jgi:ubiquinone biosynthesis protein UbiJ